MTKEKLDNLKECMKDIKKYIEDSRDPKDRINHMKRKIEYLGAVSKKPLLNFKHIRMLKEHKQIKRTQVREKREIAGIKHKKKR